MNENREQIYLAALLDDSGVRGSSKEVLLKKFCGDCVDHGLLQEASSLALGSKTFVERAEGQALKPLFQNVFRDDYETAEGEWFQPAVPLELYKSCFPVRDGKVASSDHEALWTKFDHDLSLVSASSIRSAAETILFLLQKYCSNLASGYADDISLYDYLKMKAAVAICLFDLHSSGESPDDELLLIGGDVNGIQKYINTIVSKYAGKNLKGRSFYLRMLSDACTRFLIDKLNVFRANVVYDSGGSFYLLAANTVENVHVLDAARDELEKRLFDVHGTTLHISVDSVAFSSSTLLNTNVGNLREKWAELFRKREKRKYNRLSSILVSGYTTFFEPSSGGGDVKIDVVGGEEIGKNEKVFSENDLAPLKKINWEQIKLGASLRDFEFLIVSAGRINSLKRQQIFEPLGLGYAYYLLNQSDLSEISQGELNSMHHRITILTMNDSLNFMSHSCANSVQGFAFYGGNEFGTPVRQTFSEMCLKYGEDVFKRLGVLRMDVDNLGYIFQAGIPAQKASLARFSSLSRSFDYFFSGYLNTIWRSEASDQSFIIYSGGDDLFIVGSWETMLRLAKRIRDDFREFTCWNEAFSISCGVAILPPKFPIMKGAEESANEENNAKNHNVGGHRKNSISFFNMALNWDMEFPAVEKLKSQLVFAIRQNSLPKSFISKVLSLCLRAQFKNHTTTYYKLYWMAAYTFSRMLEQQSLSSDARKLVEACLHDICGRRDTLCGMSIRTEYHPLELWALACRWAELEYRTINQA